MTTFLRVIFLTAAGSCYLLDQLALTTVVLTTAYAVGCFATSIHPITRREVSS